MIEIITAAETYISLLDVTSVLLCHTIIKISFKLLHRIANSTKRKQPKVEWLQKGARQLSSNSSVTMLSSYRSSRGVTVARKEHKISSLLSFWKLEIVKKTRELLTTEREKYVTFPILEWLWLTAVSSSWKVPLSASFWGFIWQFQWLC